MLTQALAAYIRDLGGEVIPNQEVDEILVENGRAHGVRTVHGDL
jgi:phytoene dehydrogenase-like protein